MSCLYILEINPWWLLVLLLFPYSEGFLLILFIVSFAVQKHLKLTMSHMLIFLSIFIILEGGLKKILLQFMS